MAFLKKFQNFLFSPGYSQVLDVRFGKPNPCRVVALIDDSAVGVDNLPGVGFPVGIGFLFQSPIFRGKRFTVGFQDGVVEVVNENLLHSSYLFLFSLGTSILYHIYGRMSSSFGEKLLLTYLEFGFNKP
jgi:hypothetical protein